MDKYKINVDVQTKFLSEQSNVEDDQYAFCYTITIFNQGDTPATLMRRHWQITNADGQVREVEGKGVIGEQPHLHPGESFRYTSGAVIDTPVGSMQGTYEMLSDDGTTFKAQILPFRLAVPEMVH